MSKIKKLVRLNVAEQHIAKDPNSIKMLKSKYDRRFALAEKIMEESKEVSDELTNERVNKTKLIEELADVREIIDTILYLFQLENQSVVDAQDDKYELKGGFEEFYLRLKKL